MRQIVPLLLVAMLIILAVVVVLVLPEGGPQDGGDPGPGGAETSTAAGSPETDGGSRSQHPGVSRVALEGVTADASGTGRTWQLQVLAGGEPLEGARVETHRGPPGLAPFSFSSLIQESRPTVEPAAEQSLRSVRQLGSGGGGGRFDGAAKLVSSGVTDDKGVCTIQGRSHEVFLVVEAEGWTLDDEDRRPWPRDQQTGEWTVALRAAGSLRGHVHTSAGAPLEGAVVTASESLFLPSLVMGGANLRLPATTRTDDQGLYAFPSLPPGRYKVRAKDADNASSESLEVSIVPGATAQQDLILPQAAVLRVQVTHAGAPIEGASVRLSPAQISLDALELDQQGKRDRTEADGWTEFRGLSEGTMQLEVDHPSYVGAPKRTVSLEEGQVLEQTIVLEAGLSMKGQVLSAEGEALADARVTGTVNSGTLWFIPQPGQTRTARTDAEGFFELQGLPAGPVEVRARAEHHEDGEVTIEAGVMDARLVLVPLAAVEGIVVSKVTSGVVKDFSLEVEYRGGSLFGDPEQMAERLFTRTGIPFHTEDGKFRLSDVDAGTLRLHVSAEGHAPSSSQWLEVAESQVVGRVVFYLDAEAVVEGIVLDHQTGEAVAGAEILVKKAQSPIEAALSTFLSPPSLKSDEDGLFRLGGLAAGRLDLEVRHPDYAANHVGDLALAPGQWRRGVEVRMKRGGTIHGQVVSASGEPVVGAQILVVQPTQTNLRSSSTDGDGWYEVHGLEAARYQVTRFPDTIVLDPEKLMEQMTQELRTQLVVVPEEGLVRVDFGRPPEGGAVVAGEVVSAGQGLAGALVTVIPQGESYALQTGGPRTSSSDAQGRFRLEGLPSGEAIVQMQVMDRMPGMPGATRIQRVRLAEGRTTDVTFRLPGATVSGRLLEAGSRRPAAGVLVTLGMQAEPNTSPIESLAQHYMAAASSDAEGAFELRHVPAGAAYLVVAGPDLMGLSMNPHAATRIPVFVDSDRLDVGDILVQQGAVLAGHVEDPSGNAVRGASLFLEGPAGPLQQFSTCSTDDSGAFRLTGVPAGRWTLLCRARGFAPTEMMVNVSGDGAEGLLLELDGGTDVYAAIPDGFSLTDGSFRVRLEDDQGRVLSGWYGMADLITLALGVQEGDRLYLGSFAPGTYWVRGSTRSGPIAERVVIGAGPTQVIQIPTGS